MTDTAKTLTPKQVAEKLSTDPKTLRRFLRATHGDQRPGQGGRWEIPAADVTKLKKEFATWTKAQEEAKAKREQATAAKAATADEPEAPQEPETHIPADVVGKAVADGKLPSGKPARTRRPRAGSKTAAA